MKVIESVGLKVDGYFYITDQNNNVIVAKKNLIVNTAKTIMASALAGNPGDDYVSYIAFGDPDGGATAPIVTDVALEKQVYQASVSYQSTSPPYFEDQTESGGTTTQTSTVIFSGIIDSSSSFNATEAGLFSLKEFLFSRITFSQITKNAGDTWLVKWKLAMSLS